MICDTCMKALVCKFKEECNGIKKKVESIFKIDIRCNEYKEHGGMGVKPPYIPNGIDKSIRWDLGGQG